MGDWCCSWKGWGLRLGLGEVAAQGVCGLSAARGTSRLLGAAGTQRGEEMGCFRKDSAANLASIPHCGHLLETERHRRGSNISPGTGCPAQHNQLPMDCAGTGPAFCTCMCQRALKKCKDSKFGHRTTFSLTK